MRVAPRPVREAVEFVVRGVNGLLPRGVPFGIERHDAEGVGERVEESDGIAHVASGDTAWRSSGSDDRAAAARTDAARESLRPGQGQRANHGNEHGVLGGSRSLPRNNRPPSDNCRSASRTGSRRSRAKRVHRQQPAILADIRRQRQVDHVLNQLRRARVSNGRQPEVDDARVAVGERREDAHISLVRQRQLQTNGFGAHAGVGMLRPRHGRERLGHMTVTGRAASACFAARTTARRAGGRSTSGVMSTCVRPSRSSRRRLTTGSATRRALREEARSLQPTAAAADGRGRQSPRDPR